MANFTTTKILEQESGHKHEWEFYDNYSGTFQSVLNKKEYDLIQPLGTVWECLCGAREIRFVVWTGEFDPRKRNNQNE